MSLKTTERGDSDPDTNIGEIVGEELLHTTGNKLGSIEPHVFSNTRRAAHWLRVYEDATYEGRHRFDPAFTWTEEEEKVLRRKVSVTSLKANPRVVPPRLMLTLFVAKAGLENYGLGLDHVFKPRSRPSQHQSRSLRQHGKGLGPCQNSLDARLTLFSKLDELKMNTKYEAEPKFARPGSVC